MTRMDHEAVAVIVPAHDEEATIEACIQSVLAALAHARPAASTVVVVADACSDRTAALAGEVLRTRGAVVEIDDSCVGTARRSGAELALATLGRDCWLAHTDADSTVPVHWVAEQQRLAAAGIDAVAGTVRVDSFVEHPPGARERFVASYLVHADGTHPHVHGTNFGVRGRRYLEAGGWGDHETAEDHDLWNRLRALDGIQLVASDALTVPTSGRVTGRAPRGFADTLRRVCLEAS